MKVRKSSVIIGTLTLVATLALSTAAAVEQEAPPRAEAAKVKLTEVAQAENPTAGVAGPADTVWIAERAGKIRVMDEQGLGEPVLDISDETTVDGERGLLGLAFDYGAQHLYISFTDLKGTSTIDEFAMEDGRIKEDTRRTVLTQEQPYSNHNGGDIAFGPDGMLYIAFGDGGSGGDPHGNGQNLDTLLGKLLRIDPSKGDPYAIPEGNPFAGDPKARDEIWSYGLRNPWRFSFDEAKGDLLIGDVGQSAREEIDWAPASSYGGENYGWSQMEGTLPFREGQEPANHVPPVFEYDHTPTRCSVTGGYVYRGEAVPGLRGSYVFSDYCEGDIRALTMKNGQVTKETNLGVNGGEIVAFAQGGDRELYALALGGSVYRLDAA
ncbi:PQQ-dependent sugar dehydrogenase [Streptomyces iconiensis]|uniref:PQQ-dependent sugar dehydrogenase n=1 Tax=Streptomyces iconiensis TaxID=1384038 RepID=A0ABT7A417_9ACTN|nr:PQQ-dependent sugar dehydrogenase [Streptomyces iconiensis]MDJ1136060.1 PQQ-dependent sugar dehydrogenase [Streptomyces iconiensis]